jgi:hypothetical protein
MSTTRFARLALGLALFAPTLAAAPAALAQAAPAAATPAADLPDGKDLMEAAIKAAGGREAMAKVTSRVTTIEVAVPARNFKGTITLYQLADKGAIVTTFPGLGEIKQVVDGDKVVEANPMTGNREVTGKEAAMLRRSVLLNAELDYAKHYPTIKTVGLETLPTGPAYKVELTSAEGATETRYFDQKTGDIVRVDMTAETQMGAMKTVTRLSDYRTVGESGLRIPYKSEQEVAGVNAVSTVQKVEQNVDIKPDVFQAAAAAPTGPTPGK